MAIGLAAAVLVANLQTCDSVYYFMKQWQNHSIAALFGGILTTPDSNTWSASYDAPHPLSILACARVHSFARGT